MLKVRQNFLEHAANLVASAERVLKDDGYPNIAYHLGILALEEIGKAGMISARAAVGNARDTDWMDKRFGDHVWKIQWAVWSPSLFGKRIDPKDFEKARRFGDWDGSSDTLVASLHRVFAEIIPEQDHRNQLFDIVPPPHRTSEGAFTNAVNAKRLADLYLVLVADRTMAKHMQRSTEQIRKMPASV
jgi:AbiV family abortive infection protein